MPVLFILEYLLVVDRRPFSVSGVDFLISRQKCRFLGQIPLSLSLSHFWLQSEILATKKKMSEIQVIFKS